MRILKVAALAGAIVAGALGLSQGGATASPLASGAMPALQGEGGVVAKVYHRGWAHGVNRRAYRSSRVVYRPVYRTYRTSYRPRRVYPAYRVQYRPIYRPYRAPSRVVCRVRNRYVRVGGGYFVRRPVRVCTRRY